ncbi:MAG: PAS domain S-box protein [Bacteroidetes bacterium]|nr:PAS domain S-box protein [Bacteroidota bacterium]
MKAKNESKSGAEEFTSSTEGFGANVLVPRLKIRVPDKMVWLIGIICALPVLLNVIGIDFGFIGSKIDPYRITQLYQFEQETALQEILRGRYVHTIFVSISITISFLTILLAFIDYRIKGELSTPIVGVALFCSGLFDTFHVLSATQIIHTQTQQFYLASFTWFFCRLFHASILILGTGIFLARPSAFREESSINRKRTFIWLSVLFVTLTFFTIGMLYLGSDIPQMLYPYRNLARSYDLLPLILYAILGLYILPRFQDRFPSLFAQTLSLSMIPAVATQLYMVFGSNELFDNNFNISHFMAAITYVIPFIGISLNYLETHRSEQSVIKKLNEEVLVRQETEEKLSGILNSSPSAIMAFTTIKKKDGTLDDLIWTIANPALTKLFGLNQTLLPGKKLSEMLPDTRKEGWFELLNQVITSGDPISHEYYSQAYKKWFYLVAVPLKNGLALTVSDISRRKNAQEELLSAERLAITGKLARIIAHEVRNPLTNIHLAATQMKSELPPSAEASVYPEIIERNTSRIDQLISELLNSSRPEQILTHSCDLNVLVNDARELIKDRMHLKNITLELKLSSISLEIEADPVRIRTALLNIMLNGIEAMEEGKGKLIIQTSKENNDCLLSITDNGTGIKEEDLPHLFDPFFSKKAKGMGLGLTTTQNIIQSHKGTIQATSQLGKGTTFTLRFPQLR